MGRRRGRRIVLAVVGVVLVLILGGLAYVADWASSRALAAPATGDCRTPDLLLGWEYEAVNYDRADDAQLPLRNADLKACTWQGTKAGTEIVAVDGIRIAAWYIPAASGAGPTAPTIVLAHGHSSNKSGILPYGRGLHADFNLVAFDFRNAGRSTGNATTLGALEQRDLRAVIDWLERTKHPSKIGVLGNSMGAAAAISEAATDSRVRALALDSMHTRLRYQLEARAAEEGFPAYPTLWLLGAGVTAKTDASLADADAEDALPGVISRPILLTHGTADEEDLPARTQAFYERALSLGASAELHWCPGSGHRATAGMPFEVCASDFATWTRTFFARTLA